MNKRKKKKNEMRVRNIEANPSNKHIIHGVTTLAMAMSTNRGYHALKK